MENYFDILKTNILFSNIEKDDFSSLLSCLNAKKVCFQKGEYVWELKNEINQVGIVLSGSVSIIEEDYWGNRFIYNKCFEGEMFGESFACVQIAHSPVNVIASENTQILFIEFKNIITTCSNVCAFHSKLIENMLKVMAGKNIMLTIRMEHLSKRKTRDELLSFLSYEAFKANSNSFLIRFNRQELADYLSVDRSALSNELCKLRDEGVISFNKNSFILH